MKKFIVLAVIIMATEAATGQSVRKYSNAFMNIGVNAAAFGMAGAVTANSSDVYSSYWNPAGLTQVEDYELGLMHASYFANIANYDYIGGAMPLEENSVVAFSMIRFGVDDILNTTQLIDDQGNINYDRITRFSAADYAFTFSYARYLPATGLSVAANVKVIRRIIGEFAGSWGFGFDVGIRYHTNNNWTFAAMARDITTTYNMWNINEEKYEEIQNAVPGKNQKLPETTEITLPKLNLGVAKTFTIQQDFDILLELDLKTRFTQTEALVSTSSISMTPAFGFEVGYIDMVYLRGGVGNFQHVPQLDGSERIGFQPSFGVGFEYSGIHIDYAFTDIGNQSLALYSNVFSLKIDWSAFR